MKGFFSLRGRSSPQWTAIVLLLSYGIVCTGMAFFLPATAKNYRNVFLPMQFLAAVWAIYSCVQSSRLAQYWDAPVQRAWLFMAAALSCCAIRVGFGFFNDQMPVTQRGATLSVVDFFGIVQQPFMWIALWSLAWLHVTRDGRIFDSLRIITDTAIVVLSVLILYWASFIELGIGLPWSNVARFLWFFYPLADIASLFGVVLLLLTARGRLHLTRAASLIALGFGFFIATRVTVLLGLMRGRHDTGLEHILLNTGWIWACILIGCAAYAHSVVNAISSTERIRNSGDTVADYSAESFEDLAREERFERRWQRFFVIWLPYIAALLTAGILLWGEVQNGRSEVLQRMLPTLSLLLVIVLRQMLTLWDNTRLAERLSKAKLSLEVVNSDLEKNVQERTQHLSTLHGITSTLNTSLDRRTVLRVALERTIKATGADSGGIWLRVAEGESLLDADSTNESRRTYWELAHAYGLSDNGILEKMLRDLAIAAAEEQNTSIALLPSTRQALQYGYSPGPNNIVLVPIRWGGALLGTFGLLRQSGSFTYEDRALVESVALEAGTALQNARLYQEARYRADRDSVTGLLNHRAIQERLNAELKRAQHNKGELAVVMMDLNNFKFFNDTYGHPVGDEVLRTVSLHLNEVCYESDIVGRYGGDEFIALLLQTDTAGAQEFARRVALRLNEQHFQAETGARIPIEMAFGWAVYPHDAGNALELLTAADTHLYEYKHMSELSRTPARIKAGEQGRIEVRKLKDRAAGGSFGVLDALVTAIDNKDHYTRRHSEEVTHYSLLIAKELGYSEEAQRAVRISALLHDVGKIAVPDEILRLPGQLGPEEWAIMKQHPVFGAMIVKDLPHLQEVLDGVRHHHERWDGRGYPDALAQNDIPVMGRLLAVGDCFSAMTTNRPYRKAFTPEDALLEIERGIGIQFDPLMAQTFIRAMRRELAQIREEIDEEAECEDTAANAEARDEVVLVPNNSQT